MYTYKHKQTGNVITTHGKVTGGSWELVKAEKKGGRRTTEPNKDAEKNQEDSDEE